MYQSQLLVYLKSRFAGVSRCRLLSTFLKFGCCEYFSNPVPGISQIRLLVFLKVGCWYFSKSVAGISQRRLLVFLKIGCCEYLLNSVAVKCFSHSVVSCSSREKGNPTPVSHRTSRGYRRYYRFSWLRAVLRRALASVS